MQAPGFAIVGSRRCTPYGREVARSFGRDLAARGVAVVSGLALGIDAAAHTGALESGFTAAVLGCGADVVYPAAHRALYDRILNHGVILSELPLGTKPAAGPFPRRNRIISGLSLGVVVAEAPQRSGALITARCALEQNREVFAVPGEVTNLQCAGTLALPRDGACLARDAQDVFDELWTKLPTQVQLASHSTTLQQLMLRLELSGLVEALPGGAYSGSYCCASGGAICNSSLALSGVLFVTVVSHAEHIPQALATLRTKGRNVVHRTQPAQAQATPILRKSCQFPSQATGQSPTGVTILATFPFGKRPKLQRRPKPSYR